MSCCHPHRAATDRTHWPLTDPAAPRARSGGSQGAPNGYEVTDHRLARSERFADGGFQGIHHPKIGRRSRFCSERPALPLVPSTPCLIRRHRTGDGVDTIRRLGQATLSASGPF